MLNCRLLVVFQSFNPLLIQSLLKKTTLPTSSKLKSLLRKGLIFLGVVLLLIGVIMGIGFYRLDHYLRSNQPKVLDNLPFLNEGLISFEETSLSVFDDFPNATITLHNVQIKDSANLEKIPPFLQLEKVKAFVSLQDWMQQKMDIQKVFLEEGSINIHTDYGGYSNLKNLFLKKKSKNKSNHPKGFFKNFHLNTTALDLTLNQVAVHLTNDLKTTNIHGKIHHLQTILDLEKKDLATQIDLDISVEELTFKEGKGSFVKDSRLRGIVGIIWKDNLLDIAPFSLKINEEIFQLEGHFYTSGAEPSTFYIINQATDLEKVKPLLTDKLQKELAPYQVADPFYAKAKITTSFEPDDKPLVEVDFDLHQQDIVVHKVPLQQTTVKGKFVNRLAKEGKEVIETKKRFRFDLDNLTTKHESFYLKSDKVLITSTLKTGPRIKMAVNLSGKASGISDWLNNDQFIFEEGKFNLNAAISGSLRDINSIIIESDAEVNLQDFSVVYQPANASFPFKEMRLRKDAGDAFFSIINSSLAEHQDLLIDGWLKNMPALLFELVNKKVTSQADLTVNKLTWTDFLNWFGKNGLLKKGKPKTEVEKKQSMKKTIQGIYANFAPKLSIKIDTLAYFDLLQLDKFQTALHFENEHVLILEETSFAYDGGSVTFSGLIDISHPTYTPFEFKLETKQLNLAKALPALNYLNVNILSSLEALPTDLDLSIEHSGILDDKNGLMPNTSDGKILFSTNKGADLIGEIIYEPDTTLAADVAQTITFGKTAIALSGNPAIFNNFFKTEQFFFNDGQFNVAFDYVGNLGSMKEILTNGDAVFSLKDSEVLYKPVGVTFPLQEIDLKLKGDKATFDLDLVSDSLQENIHLNGNIEHISELLVEDTDLILKTDIHIQSKKIILSEILGLFSSGISEQAEKAQSIKTTLKGLLSVFEPNFTIEADTFIYSDKFVLENLHTGVYLKDSTKLFLDNSNFNLHGGFFEVDGHIELGQPLRTPFKTHIKTSNLKLKEIVESLDYLSLPSLKNTDKLGGKANLEFNFAGIIDDKVNGLMPNATEGTLVFDLQDVLVIGFDPLKAISKRLFWMDGRFEEVKFAPIVGEIYIKGQEIEFPQLEIQSNALHLFMEGTLSYGDLTNMWVSIPVNNLGGVNRYVIPEKTGYAAAKAKVYIEVTSDENGENKFKFRLSKRKFYKSRDILEQYKIDRKRNRAIKRALRKKDVVLLEELYEAEDGMDRQ